MVISNLFSDRDDPELLGFPVCAEALTSNRLTSDPYRVGRTRHKTGNMLTMDGTRHIALRRLVRAFLSSAWQAEAVEDLNRLGLSLVADAFAAGVPQIDLKEKLVRPLVYRQLCATLGISASSVGRLGEDLHAMSGILEPDQSAAEERQRMMAMVAVSRSLQDASVLSQPSLSAALVRGYAAGEIDRAMCASTPVVVAHGGYENPMNLSANIVAHACQNPEQLHQLAPGELGGWVELALLRSDSVKRVLRFSFHSQVFGGVVLSEGQPVWLGVGSANRELTNDQMNRHLAFGRGRHRCPGVAPARALGVACLLALRQIPVPVLASASIDWHETHLAKAPVSVVVNNQ